MFSTGQPIDELYLSLEVLLNDVNVYSKDEALCLPHFPRFTFCGSRRGGEHRKCLVMFDIFMIYTALLGKMYLVLISPELIIIDSSFQSKVDLPLKVCLSHSFKHLCMEVKCLYRIMSHLSFSHRVLFI